MTMRKQPQGLHRQREGDAKTGEGGKPLPPDSFGIFTQDKTRIGTTHRVGRTGWQARTLAGHGSRESAVFPRHTEAMSWLGDQWQARDESGEGSAPAREGGQSHEAEHVREVPRPEQGDQQGEEQGDRQEDQQGDQQEGQQGEAEVTADAVPVPVQGGAGGDDDPFGDPFAP